jgi:hypothetical protein
MHVISTNPALYSEVCECGVLNTILGLLAHENVDIAAATISLIEVYPYNLSYLLHLQDLIDVEAVEDSLEDARKLLSVLFGQQMPVMLLQAVYVWKL